MSNYIGVRCPVCSKKFTSSDDIVVCPICGAPHHRDCYQEQGQCVFSADHLTGKEWSAPVEPGASQPGEEGGATSTCAKCGAKNPPEAIFCQICGNPMAIAPGPGRGPQQTHPHHPHQQWNFPGVQVEVDAISMCYGGLSPEEEIEGHPVKDVATYVGSNSAYYLPRFKMMSETGRTLSPNFAAMFFNFFYYFYRKMYLIGGLLLGLYLVSIIPSFLYIRELMLPQMLHEMGLIKELNINYAAAEHFTYLSSITRTINFIIGFLVSLCANRFYYSRTMDLMGKLKDKKPEGQPEEQYRSVLASAGGCSKGAVIAAGATVLAVTFIANSILIFLMIGP